MTHDPASVDTEVSAQPQSCPNGSTAGPDRSWVDEFLLAGADHEACLRIGRDITRSELRRLVEARQRDLTAAGLSDGGVVALRLPPSLVFVTTLLAAWRAGAQAVLLDYRLTSYEVDRALERTQPQVVVASDKVTGGALRGYFDVDVTLAGYPGRPAATPHAVVQLSSGSTGPSKVIGRTAEDLMTEVGRYLQLDGMPRTGERTVLLASMVHVLGLVGGLLYGLHAGVRLVLPERMTVEHIFTAVRTSPEPATLLGVPFHIELLAAVAEPPHLPQLAGMTTGGELVRGNVSQAFADRYGVRLGNMYGMTEVGVIATDLFGEHRPALRPAPGLTVRESGGELLVGLPASPYIGLSDPTRYVDGWLHTRDAGGVDPDTGLVTVRGRLDSQVSIGGLKVDLTEVEHTLAALPGVEQAVVSYDNGIEAYVVLRADTTADDVSRSLADRLAGYKRPKALRVVAELPRTATGKLVRDRAVLRSAEGSGTAP